MADFEQIVDQYSERIYWVVRRMVASHDDANDVVQNTFIKVWQALPDFRGQSSIYTWIYRIAVNQALSFLRSERSRPNVGGEMAERELAAIIDYGGHFDGTQAERALQIAIQKLPEKQRAVFLLRYYDEMPYAEMAVVLETSEGALKASYHHAVKKIEQELNVSILQTSND